MACWAKWHEMQLTYFFLNKNKFIFGQFLVCVYVSMTSNTPKCLTNNRLDVNCVQSRNFNEFK